MQLDKQADKFTPEDIEGIVANKRSEGVQLDFKRDLDTSAKDDVPKDVAAFANSQGGILIYGISEVEDTGEASGVSGITDSLEAGEQTIVNKIKDFIEPRIQGCTFGKLKMKDGKNVLVVGVPKSWCGPHLIKSRKNDNSYRLYHRFGTHNIPVGEPEFREAFRQSGDIPSKIREWRNGRIAAILAGDGPIKASDKPMLVAHIVPLASVTNDALVDPGALYFNFHAWSPISGSAMDPRLNLDGLLVSSGGHQNTPPSSYLQLYRSAQVETAALLRHQEWHLYFSPEIKTTASLNNCIGNLAAAAVPFPFCVFFTLLNVRGMKSHSAHTDHRIDRDHLFFPEVLLDKKPENDDSLRSLLRPIFDAYWQSFGCLRSPHFDSKGAFIANPNSESVSP